MDYKKITSCEMEALWTLQKLYQTEIGEDAPNDEGRDRLGNTIDKGTISFWGVACR